MGKDIEKFEFSYIATGNVKCVVTLEYKFPIPQTVTLWLAILALYLREIKTHVHS